MRWWVDRARQKDLEKKNIHLSEEELTAEGDKSPGVLMASGYIAGGAIAGILIAFSAGGLENVDASLTKWATDNNPFFNSDSADLLSMIPFVLICALLLMAGREMILTGKKKG